MLFLVGEGGFEPPKALPADLQSVPFGHSGIPPYSFVCGGAGGRTRTPDLLITNQLLYQLSYTSRPCGIDTTNRPLEYNSKSGSVCQHNFFAGCNFYHLAEVLQFSKYFTATIPSNSSMVSRSSSLSMGRRGRSVMMASYAEAFSPDVPVIWRFRISTRLSLQ